MMRMIRSKKGFTLVELMIVVAIIGILAAIAIPNFLNFRLKAKTSEAKSNLGAIRSTEVAYFAEWGNYVVNQLYTPDHTVADTLGYSATNWGDKKTWDPTTRFSILGFAPEGQVFYDYNLTSDTADAGDIPADTGLDANAFSARARGDLDNDRNYAYFVIDQASTEIGKSGAPF